MESIKLGISACLLGENVRYNGGHKLDRYLRDILGRFVKYVPVCPEFECGLGIPRPAMRLIGDPEAPRLITINTKTDKTNQMLDWINKKLPALEKENLCGFIFKAKSPSSGMRDIKIYNASGIPQKKGVGIFAKAFMDAFPNIPVEDEGRLHDAGIRENFIERVFTFHRWKQTVEGKNEIRRLVNFHTEHKLLIMAHSPSILRDLGRITAETKNKPTEILFDSYFSRFQDAIKLKTTIKKHVNVLQHLMGYFKKNISPPEKKELLEIIDQYHKGYIPLVVPVTLINHYVRKYQEPYLLRQVYLNPHPVELMLRNHV